MDEFEQELKLGFLDEAAQSLSDVEQCFLALESQPNDDDNLNKIFRLAHNLKGSSKAVGFDQMGAFTHEFETYILKIKKGDIAATPTTVNLLLRCNDFIAQMVQDLRTNLSASFDIDPLLNELKNGASAPQETVAVEETGVVEETVATEETVPVEEAVAPVETAAVEATVSVPNEVLPPQTAPSLKIVPPPSAPVSETKAPAKSSAPDESIRVSVSKVEALLNSIGEMVILQSVLKEQADLTQSIRLKKNFHQLGKVTKEIQEISMGLRMVPVKPTFQKMQRIVRDTAQALSKDVAIVLVGEDTELDKTVLEKINDPLVHLIRNSVDHGIESAEKRKACGKPMKGIVTLSAFHQSGKLVIEVSDDGGGLDAKKLTEKAIEKGILRPGTQLSEKDAFALIFAAGFSTKEAVTDVSGRGVGMDVVRTNIQDLSGEIFIHSTLGKGTTFQIVLPLTLAIIEGMVVTYGVDRFVLPFNHVFETLRPAVKDMQTNKDLGLILMLRQENIPLFRLGDFFGKPSEVATENMIAMIVRNGPKPFGLLVDDILGTSQVVVKQLGPELQGFKGVSGCTILGDGRPALILEPTDLVKRTLSVVARTDLKQGGRST